MGVRDETLEAMRAERGRHAYYCPGGYKKFATCKCGWEATANDQIAKWEHHVESAVLDAALVVQTSGCETCGGTGEGRPTALVHTPSGVKPTAWESCPTCNGTGRVQGDVRLAFVRQVESAWWDEDEDWFHRDPVSAAMYDMKPVVVEIKEEK